MKKKIGLIVLKVLLSIVLIAFILNSINSNDEIFDSFGKIDLKWVSFTILFMIPNILIQSYKWLILLRTKDSNVTFWQSAGSTIGGISLGLLTPGKIGELAKGLFLKKFNKLELAGLALLERIYNMAVIIFLGILSFVAFAILQKIKLDFIFWTLLAVMILMLFISIVMLIYPTTLQAIAEKLFKKSKYKDKIYLIFRSYQFVGKDSIVKIIITTLIFQLLNSTQFVMSIWAFDSMLSFSEGIISGNATTFTKAVLPFTIGDLGIRENAAIHYFSFFIENKAAIFNGSIMIFFVNIIFPSLCGLFMLPKMNFQKDLKQ